MDCHLHGRHSYHGENTERTRRTNETCSSMLKGQRLVLETREMQIQSNGTRISGTDHLGRTNSNGRSQACWNQAIGQNLPPLNKYAHFWDLQISTASSSDITR